MKARLPWLKLWHEARTDLKLRSLTSEQFRVWFNLLCYASEQPERGIIVWDDPELLALEVSGGDVPLLDETLKRLETLRIVSCVSSRFTPVSSGVSCNAENRFMEREVAFLNFEKRNAEPVSSERKASTDRVRKHRERKKLEQQPWRNETPKRDETPAETRANETRRNACNARNALEGEGEGEGEGDVPPPSPPLSVAPAPPPSPAPGRMSSSGIVNGHPAREGATPTRSGRPPASSAEEAEALLAWAAAQLGDRLALEDFGPKVSGYARDYPAGWVEQAVLLARANARPGGLDQYVNKLLLKWHAQGRTDADALAARDAGRGSAALPPPAPAAPPDFYARLKPPARRRPASAPGPGPIAEDG